MSKSVISGIQQVGIGVSSHRPAMEWYARNLAMDIKIFEEEAVAELMTPHTEGGKYARYAYLNMNLQGGGGFEIWQHTERTPMAPTFKHELGDFGINILKMKSYDVDASRRSLLNSGVKEIGEIVSSPNGVKHFFFKDPYGNTIQIIEDQKYYRKTKHPIGGVLGAVIGVSDIDRALAIYKDLLGYDKIVYDESRDFNDLGFNEGGSQKFRRVLLTHSEERIGPFAPWLGFTELELIQKLDKPGRKIYDGRIWGDLGYIHICFDVLDMDKLKLQAADAGYPFTVDSANSFDMGEAAGRFAYIEDPDGTLIEFVETHKIPIMKKIGWYLDLTKRPYGKPLSPFMLNMMKVMRVKP